MATKKELPKNIINPFSEHFLETWDLWKQYKKEQFNFRYKGVLSEQSALYNLYTISLENERTAINIINQSMAAGWRGLFELKNNNNGQKLTTISGKTIEFDRP